MYSGQQKIIDYASKFTSFSENEQIDFAAAFKEVSIKKKQLIIQPGFVAKHRYFVLDGAMRAYVIGEDGQEHSVQLAITEWWISDYSSYMFQEPASMFVMAIEDSKLLQISFENERALKAANHKYETFFRMLAERSAAFMQRRFISGLILSAEEKYNIFMEKYPSMANRFPQYVIASYLGMTTEFLSKIRNQKIKKKI